MNKPKFSLSFSRGKLTFRKSSLGGILPTKQATLKRLKQANLDPAQDQDISSTQLQTQQTISLTSVTSIRNLDRKETWGKLINKIPQFRSRFTLRDQSLFAKRLSLLVRAGVPILESLNIIKSQARSPSAKKLFDKVANDVASGRDLSRSLSQFKGVFGEFALNIIKVGESSGTLAENLIYLGNEIEKERELKRKVIGAMIYPILIVVLTFAVVLFLTVYLFPKLLPVFRGLNVDLPISTRFLLWLSNFLITDGLFVVLVLICATIGSFFLLRLKPVKFFVHRTLLRTPFVGQFFQDYQLTNIFRTLGLLLKSTMTVLDALKITGDTSTNLAYREELYRIHYAVSKGGNISSQMEKEPGLFPYIATQILAISEKTGSLSDTLIYLAEIYEQDLNEKTKGLSTVIEPALMLIMGLVVGFVAISIITPIYAITQHITPR